MHVLIIDDEADIRYTLQEICLMAGWQSSEAANGTEGLARFDKERPDLVLCDYHMPEKDGLITVKELRKRSKLVPIVVLTVDERQEIADAFLEAGASDFALKPIKAPDLISRLKVHLRLSRADAEVGNEEEIHVVKGISKMTLELIKEHLINSKSALTIADIANNSSLAYPTVHRYLMYLMDKGEVEVEADYGKVGRPKNKYVLKNIDV